MSRWLAAFLLAGCLDTSTVECASGIICPAGMACDDVHRFCVLPVQLERCRGLASDDPCSYGETSGQCYDGVCLAIGCGNGIPEAGEVCDRGDTVDGDGCSADCRSLEVCGNAITDRIEDEECDCGDGTQDAGPPAGCRIPNSNEPGSICSTLCHLRGCGDGEVVTPEECEPGSVPATCGDLGYYGAGAPDCTPFCRFDPTPCESGGYCGDGVQNGPEPCDFERDEATASCLDYGFDLGRLGCTGWCTPDVAECLTVGWRVVSSGTSVDLQGVWGSAADDIWAVGSDGTFLHFNGSFWDKVEVLVPLDPSGDPADLADVSGSAADDVWAVGMYGVALHFDGTTWTAEETGTELTLFSVITDGEEVIAVGELGTIVHRVAGVWLDESVASPRNLTGIDYSLDTPYVVARTSDATRQSDIWRREAGGWTRVVTDLAADLEGVWFAPDGHGYATGGFGYLIGFDGATWAEIPTNLFTEVVAVWGDTDLLQIVGDHGATLQPSNCGLQRTQLTTEHLRGVWGTAVDDVWAVGMAGTIGHFDGLRWEARDLTVNHLRDVWVVSDCDRFVVGEQGSLHQLWSGGLYSLPTDTTETLFGVWASAIDNVWAVGDNVIVRWGGFVDENTLIDKSGVGLRDVWGAASDDIWAVGLGGAIEHYDGVGWTPAASPTSEDLLGVYGVAGDDVWAVGNHRTILHFDGAAWTVASTGGAEVLTGVWAGAGDDAWAVGSLGLTLHWDGAAWGAIPSGTTDRLNAVWGRAPGDVWAAGAVLDGRILRWDGVSWRPVKPLRDEALNGVAGRGMMLYLVGRNGAVLELNHAGLM